MVRFQIRIKLHNILKKTIMGYEMKRGSKPKFNELGSSPVKGKGDNLKRIFREKISIPIHFVKQFKNKQFKT